MGTCCFTGHRIMKITPELKQRLREAIVDVVNQGVTEFYNGGAIGWDMLCAETVIDLNIPMLRCTCSCRVRQRSRSRVGTSRKSHDTRRY